MSRYRTVLDAARGTMYGASSSVHDMYMSTHLTGTAEPWAERASTTVLATAVLLLAFAAPLRVEGSRQLARCFWPIGC